ncbi:ABC transporter permease [Neobacillus rhizophilus]|uniref:ABC transporter permease n=1 Tax=Neobacillus rhizophilus TaxID=2833579 RepID=A0A942YUD1_9BACI|nr:ABC transporter permease [Neobacillus rhizophilus]MBS4212802.1 ABC transporter permease [Neobacillus rhizophilus]MBU8915242.1 ABC transporter permease [Bacillus sp. FJAT-29953]
MHSLIVNEWIKIFKRPVTYVMIGLLVLGIIASGTLTKIYGDRNQQNQPQWEQQVQQQITQDQKQMSELPPTAVTYKKNLERQIAINQYRLDHKIPPATENTGWTFIKDSTSLISFAGLFTIIVAAGIVASEFSWGTVKLLLIRPIKRYKILLSKYFTVILFGLLMLAILFGGAAIFGFAVFGTGDGGSVHLAYSNGHVVEQNMLLYLIKTYFLSSIDVIMITTMAFMISAVFRNSSLAVGLSIFLLLMGGQITTLIASRYEWAKYSLFANTNLTQYFDGVPLVEGMTVGFSIIMLLIYFFIFQLLAFGVFTKRDVTA